MFTYCVDILTLLTLFVMNVVQISQRTIIDMAADRGAFIDQSQSLNIHMTSVTTAKLTSMHFHAWKRGLKTGMYYLRTKPSTDAIKFTLDPLLIKQQEEEAESFKNLQQELKQRGNVTLSPMTTPKSAPIPLIMTKSFSDELTTKIDIAISQPLVVEPLPPTSSSSTTNADDAHLSPEDRHAKEMKAKYARAKAKCAENSPEGECLLCSS
jgi:ribonucleoside-diphosphate reductase subunit M1